MKTKLKRIVILMILWGLFLIWFGNTQAPAQDLETYTGFGLISLLLSGALTLTDYQERQEQKG